MLGTRPRVDGAVSFGDRLLVNQDEAIQTIWNHLESADARGNSLDVVSWTPATDEHARATVKLAGRLLGVDVQVAVTINQITRENMEAVWLRIDSGYPPGQDPWEWLEPIRAVVGALLERRDLVASMAMYWTIANTFDEMVGGVPFEAALTALRLKKREEEILAPLLDVLPSEVVAFWRGVAEGGVWYENIGQFLEACSVVHITGPLEDLARQFRDGDPPDVPWDWS